MLEVTSTKATKIQKKNNIKKSYNPDNWEMPKKRIPTEQFLGRARFFIFQRETFLIKNIYKFCTKTKTMLF